MDLAGAIVGGIAKAVVGAALNKFRAAPEVALSYGKSGDNDLLRIHYHRLDDPRPAHPWIIVEARAIWPLGSKLMVSDQEAISKIQGAVVRTSLHMKPGTGVFFIELKPKQEFPRQITLLLKMERGVPSARRWALATVVRPSNFDLRFNPSLRPF